MTEEAPAADTGAILAANHAAADFYRTQLVRPANPGPREYLRGRGFEQLLGETRWTVGYAPSGWTSLTSHLLAAGVTEPLLEAAGLSLRARNGRLIDRFRDRLTFGIRDAKGRLVGFTARCAPGCGPTVPKYLNTPHTTVYDKSAELFGLGEHVLHGRGCGQAIVVEGPLDAIAVDIAGVGTEPEAAPLALCGTAMSRVHADYVVALDPRTVVVALDTDSAGCHGSERAYELLRDADVPLLAPALPKGEDPAACLARFGAGRLRREMNSARPLADHLVGARLASWADVHASAERELCCLRETASLTVRMRPDEVARQARRMSEVLDLPVQTVTRELIDAIAKAHDVNETTANQRTSSSRVGPSCAIR